MQLITYLNHGRIYGLFEFRKPIFLVRDPQMVKQMAIKDFDHFVDHRTVLSPDMDPLFARALISLQGQKWKGKKTMLIASTSYLLTPTFRYACDSQSGVHWQQNATNV